MKLLYFFLTSSFMIGFVLLFRKLFRKKLSANVLYALWLLPFIRLLLPVGFLEVPLFGTMAEFINRPVAVVEEFFKTSDETFVSVYEGALIPEETSTSNINAGKPSDEGIKIYDAVFPKENHTVQIPEGAFTLNDTFVHETTDNNSNINYIISIIWCAGSIVLGCYVFVQNRKLRCKINQLVPVDQIDGIDICISKAVKTPCLVGIHKPKIVLTGEVYVSPELYKYAILHEMAHYHNKDHFWNMVRIFLCILYWWHPLVWYAAKCVAEDAELACDERVLKGKNVEERKNYGYALLKMIENAQNKPLCLTTSFSGSKKSMKQRIEAISHKRATRKYILFPALLVLVALLIAGCVYPSNKSYLKTTAWENGDNGEWIYNEAEYPYSIQDHFKSYVIYSEIYEYGELVKTEVLGAAEIEDYTGSIKMRNEVSKLDENSKFILEIDDFGIEMQSLLSNYLSEGGYAHSSLHSNKQVEIKPEESLILKADFRSNNNTTQTYNCLELSRYTEDELKEQFKDNYAVGLYRIVFSELSSDQLYRKYSREDIVSDWSKLADTWAKAFVDKDVEMIKNLVTENACQQLIDCAILDEEKTTFGWSSPWPMFAEEHYRILHCNSKEAEILYYATDSTPHIYVWKEILEFSTVENETKVFSWSLERYEDIIKLDEYRKAYPNNQIINTPMDYYANGLGETLNNNAMFSSSDAYQPLFKAGSAALELLNVSKDYSLVHYNTEENGEDVDVNIQFLNKDGSVSSTSVTMWQPYGENGIWIPKGITQIVYDENKFYAEPEEGKVCLAVMPDGISKSGGDYRYIIPEDQIKWIDFYKQARSLAVDGVWKDEERSAGIWLVFDDEWTCITDQGMIFDFDKHIEKENIEEFYNICMEEAKKYGTGTPVSPEYFPEIISATLNYNGACTVTDANVLKDLRKIIYTSKEIRGGSSCPFTAALVLELTDNVYETIYLATDSCSAWLTDGVYYEYYGYNGIEEISDIFERNGVKINAKDTVLKIENNQEYVSLTSNTTSATKIIKQAEERAREGYKEAKLTYVDNAEVGWNFYNDNPWASTAERDALAQAALKELYTLTGYNVEACTYTTNGRSKFIFGKSAENIRKSIAFYSRDYGFTLYGEEIPFMGFVNARKVHYSDVQQLDSPYHKKEFQGNGAIAAWFLEHSGVYQGEKIIGFDAINLDDTVYTHIKLMFDGGYYIVLMDEKIESFHSAEGPFFE